MKNRKCPICKGVATARLQEYHSGRRVPSTGKEIIVLGVGIFNCIKCTHIWLPIDQEEKINKTIEKAINERLN